MKKFTHLVLVNRSLSLLKKMPAVNRTGFYLLLLSFLIINANRSFATSTTSYGGTSYGSSFVYAVNFANTPVGPTTYCSGGTASSYTCSDNETSCSSPFANTNTISWQWYIDGTAISGASGTYVANGVSNTATLTSALATTAFSGLTPGSHCLTCNFTPNQSNCYYASYTAIVSPSLCITISASTVGPIVGPSSICPGATVNYSDATTGGVWSSDNTPVVTISSSGAATGSSGGTANISYTLGGCGAGLAVTVGSLPAIAGPTGVCQGLTITLSDASTGGVWSSGNTAVATISPTGVVSGVTTGTSIISYTSGACSVTSAITVGAPISPITGPSSVCVGLTGAYTDATSGGTWTTSNPALATVSSTGVVTGVAVGTVTITYTTICYSTMTITIGGAIAAITGTPSVCPGTTTQLNDATPGGTWTSDNTGIITVSSTGLVTGVANGTANISYTVGTCAVGIPVTVITVAPITGTPAVCPGGTTQLTDATPGGTWSSSNLSVATISNTGLVTGGTVGTTNISYTVGSCSVGVALTVSNLPAITGPTPLNVCVGSTITLSDTAPGGVWSSGSVGVATVVSATGVVTGVASGSASISYSIGSCSISAIVAVGSAVQPITGNTTICIGSTTHLSDNTPGGTWSSTSPSVGAVSTSGVVSGLTAGTTNISYTFGACAVGVPVTVEAANGGVITGKDSVCPGPGHIITLSDAVTGGAWSSSTSALATVDPVTGVVTGVRTGAVTIKYVVTNVCGTYTVTYVVHVRTNTQCATGLNEPVEDAGTELKISPNPNSGTFTMNLLSDLDEEVHVVITNIAGAKIREFTTTTNKITGVKLEPVSGIYLLSATTAHGKYVAKIEVN